MQPLPAILQNLTSVKMFTCMAVIILCFRLADAFWSQSVDIRMHPTVSSNHTQHNSHYGCRRSRMHFLDCPFQTETQNVCPRVQIYSMKHQCLNCICNFPATRLHKSHVTQGNASCRGEQTLSTTRQRVGD